MSFVEYSHTPTRSVETQTQLTASISSYTINNTEWQKWTAWLASYNHDNLFDSHETQGSLFYDLIRLCSVQPYVKDNDGHPPAEVRGGLSTTMYELIEYINSISENELPLRFAGFDRESNGAISITTANPYGVVKITHGTTEVRLQLRQSNIDDYNGTFYIGGGLATPAARDWDSTGRLILQKLREINRLMSDWKRLRT